MPAVTVEELLSLLSRKELLRIAREGREAGLFRPIYPLTYYDASGLRRMLQRHANRLARLHSVQELLQRYSRPRPASPSKAPKAPPSLVELTARLFPGVLGMDAEKEFLLESLYLPLAFAQEAQRYGVSTAPSILIEGPPGSGKSFLVRRFAQATGFFFQIIHTPALASKWYGETEHRLRAILRKAHRHSPALLIFDEMDALFTDRDKNLEWLNGPLLQFFLLIDDIKERGGVGIIGITNRAHRLDKALLRSGRFDQRLYVREPDYLERLQILQAAAQALEFSPEISWEKWAELTQACSRADLLHLLKRAGYYAFLRHFREGKPQLITEADLQRAFKSE